MATNVQVKARREVRVGGKSVQLRAKEFDLLLALAQIRLLERRVTYER